MRGDQGGDQLRDFGVFREKQLTAATINSAIRTAVSEKKGKKLFDGGGLIFRIKASGSASWILRYKRHGRTHEMGLGAWPDVSLKEARENSFDARTQVRKGFDPLAERAKEASPTFEALSREFIEIKGARLKNPKSSEQWLKRLIDYAFPKIGKMQIETISSADVLAVLSPIWTKKAPTAERLKSSLKEVFTYSLGKGFIEANPCDAAFAALPAQGHKKTHHAAVTYKELPALLDKIDASAAWEGTKLAWRWFALTGCRSQEGRLATWKEIDLDAKTWTLEAERKKEGRELVVPLSDAAMEILERAKALQQLISGDLIFPSLRGKALSDNTLSKLTRQMGLKHTPHGCRSCLRSWCQENGVSWEVGESLLGHVIGNMTVQAYARADMLEQRRAVLERWGRYLSTESKHGASVLNE